MRLKIGSLALAVAALSGCSGSSERYTLACELTGPMTGERSEYRFAVDEPARRIGWAGVAGFIPITVDQWDEAAIKGSFALGERRVAVDYDRAQYTMTLTSNARPGRSSEGGPNAGRCSHESLTGEEESYLANAQNGQ